ncbi:MAG: hypothetical protein WCK21_03315 [Actinomycetota bacterium]
MSRRRARALILVLPGLLLAGCLTGKRPHFEDEPFPAGSLTGDANIDAVLTKLDAVTKGPATASYDVLTKYGSVTHPALVVLDKGKRSILVGNVHYIQTEALAKTCTVDLSAPCSDGFLAARISDTLATVEFYAAGTATRLRRDNQAKLGPSVAHADVFAGIPATCVDVPLSGGTAIYCVLNNGMLAKLDDGDLLITLTTYSNTADPSQFIPPT